MISFDSVDFIQLNINNQNRVYFPPMSKFRDREIYAIAANFSPLGTDITGVELADNGDGYITLYDQNNNLIFDNVPLSQISDQVVNLPEINRKIDFEKSFVTYPVPVGNTSLFLSVFFKSDTKPAYESGNVCSLTFDITNQPQDFDFQRFYKLNGKKLISIDVADEEHTSVYLYLVPRDKKRYINYVPLNFFNLQPLQSRRYINPIDIDFDQSKLLVRPTSEDIEHNTIILNFYYND